MQGAGAVHVKYEKRNALSHLFFKISLNIALNQIKI